jgi:hypothetical protein
MSGAIIPLMHRPSWHTQPSKMGRAPKYRGQNSEKCIVFISITMSIIQKNTQNWWWGI